MLFKSRTQAAHLLADRLVKYKDTQPLVLGIPRGAVPMAKIITESLHGELDVVLVRKIPAPNNPELAIGSVDEEGNFYISNLADQLGATPQYINATIQTQLELLKQRRSAYTPVRTPIAISDRTVIVVDNGVATGFTIKAALQSVHAKQPHKLIAAMAVAPQKVVQELAEIADEVICLQSPEPFHAVGQFYEDFTQVCDREVIEALRQSHNN